MGLPLFLRRHSFHGLTAKQLVEVASFFVDDTVDISSSTNKHNNDYRQYARKAGVALAGTTLTAVGLIMIPLPVPLGVVVAGAGMSVLGTEFPAAQKMLDDSKGALMGAFQRAKIYKKKKKWNATKKKIETKRIVENGEDTVVFERIPSSCSLESYSSDTSAESAKEDVFATCFSDNVSKEDGGDEFGNTKVNKSISDRGHSQWSKLKFGRIGQLFASKNMAANQ